MWARIAFSRRRELLPHAPSHFGFLGGFRPGRNIPGAFDLGYEEGGAPVVMGGELGMGDPRWVSG